MAPIDKKQDADAPIANLRPLAIEVVRKLQDAGFEAYWAGGCVRDQLLSTQPADFDIATSAPPADVSALFPGAVLVGKAFGVTRVPSGSEIFEVATFRTESNYQDGRHPESVTFADARADAMRRDFTANALFYDPITDRYLDYVEGVKDIEQHILRCVGDPEVRFREDHLRLLRAIRFAAKLNFTIEPATDAAIRNAAPMVTRISSERIREELTRILVETPRAGQALRMLDARGLLAPILPEVTALKDQAQPPEFHPEGDVFTHTMMMLDAMEAPSAELAYSILLHDIAKPATATWDGTRIRFNRHDTVGAEMSRSILKRLRFSNEFIERVAVCVRRHMHFRDVPDMRDATKRKLIGAETFPTELELHRLDCLASHGMLGNYHILVDFRDRIRQEPVLPPPLITGDDVMSLGVREGPEVGRWLRQAYDLQLDAPQTTTREVLLGWLRQQLKPQ